MTYGWLGGIVDCVYSVEIYKSAACRSIQVGDRAHGAGRAALQIGNGKWAVLHPQEWHLAECSVLCLSLCLSLPRVKTPNDTRVALVLVSSRRCSDTWIAGM
ncbi:hypothetical protein ACLOJK_025185 [Asimina triloba]